MINVRAFFVLIIVSLIGLSGCTAIVSATSDGPIKEDPGERTLGAAIDDQIIETKALVNAIGGFCEQKCFQTA